MSGKAAAADPSTIRLVADGTALRAVIDDPARVEDSRYAIYLLRNGERVAVRGYTAEREATFAGPHPSGAYVAPALCPHAATDAPRQAHPPALTVAAPPGSAARKNSDIPDPEIVESIETLSARLRPDRIQRLDVRVGPLTYNLLTGKRRRG